MVYWRTIRCYVKTTTNSQHMEKLNISQLRNLWLRSPDERLASWREFRIELQSHYGSGHNEGILLSSVAAISTWWEQCPTVSVAIDPFDSESWPNVWEIIYQGECCKYSRGLAMAYNMYYIDNSISITLNRVRDLNNQDEYMLAIVAGQYGLNSPYSQIIDLHNVDDIEVRQSYDVHDLLYQNQR